MEKCVACARPDPAYACSSCTGDLAADLARAVALAGEVETTVARLSRVRTTSGYRSGPVDLGRPLPVNLAARERSDQSLATIRHWMSLCGGNLDRLRHLPMAEQAFPELTKACADLVRVVDAPGERWYAGPCWPGQCETELYSPTEHGLVRCPECKTYYNMADRRTWLLSEADRVVTYAHAIAPALTRLGQKVTASSIRGLAHRGRISEQGRDEQGRPLYRVGEVREYLASRVRVAA